MRILSQLILICISACWLATPLSATPTPFPGGAETRTHIAAHLEAEAPSPAPGQTVTLAIVMDPEPGWHGYWENPGDAGKPLEIDWSLPAGVALGQLRYPVPETLVFSGIMNHVYEAEYAVLLDMMLPKGLAPGTRLPLRAQARWLACTDSICVPEEAELALDLTVGEGAPQGLENRARFDEYRRKLPRPLGADAVYQQSAGPTLQIAIPFPRGAELGDVHFFPLNAGLKDYAAPQTYARKGDTLYVELTNASPAGPPLRGVLRLGDNRGLVIEAQAGRVSMPPVSSAAGDERSERQGISVLIILLGAILGGLILNIMPCVFPILSVKAMNLLRGHAGPAHAKTEAWAYTAGVMLTCIALGGAVLALRAAGASIGWAFQLQSPLVVVALLALSMAIALNFAGLFMLSPVALDGDMTRRRGALGDFWAGVLVAFVATPCTGPFMAAALGAALVLPVLAGLAIFAGLGFGLALPFLLLAYFPALRARLPRPGPWMERVQRWLSVPMFLTAAALLWLLERQAGSAGLIVGGVVALATAVIFWLLGRAQRNGSGKPGWITAAACVVLLSGGMAALHERAPVRGQLADNAFSEAALEGARASGQPVFVYFTADWCLTCKANEAGAINRDEVQAAFGDAQVQVLVGDWTNGDPDITRFLESHGRSGVPLYLWYAPGAARPDILPQILTPAMLVAKARASR